MKKDDSKVEKMEKGYAAKGTWMRDECHSVRRITLRGDGGLKVVCIVISVD